MSRAKRDDFELLSYRIESLEKRFESLERIVHANPNGSNSNSAIVQELMQMVFSMMKAQTLAPSQNPAVAMQPRNVSVGSDAVTASSEQKKVDEEGSTLSLHRRLGFGM